MCSVVIADERNCKLCVGRDAEAVVAVGVGNSTVCGAYLHDGSANHWVALIVNDLTLYGNLALLTCNSLNRCARRIGHDGCWRERQETQ